MIYLLRHGQTEHNVEHRVQGHGDSPLTELGRSQARAMGAKLRDLLAGEDGFAVVASPLPRAVASAEIVREEAGLTRPIITDARLAEVGCGRWEGRPFAELAAGDPRLGEAPCFLAAWALYCPDGERLDDAVARLTQWLAQARGRKLVAVGHGVAGSLLRALYAGLGRDRQLTMRSTTQDRFHRLHGGQVEEITC